MGEGDLPFLLRRKPRALRTTYPTEITREECRTFFTITKADHAQAALNILHEALRILGHRRTAISSDGETLGDSEAATTGT